MRDSSHEWSTGWKGKVSCAGLATSPDRRVVNLTLTEAGRNAATRIAEIVPAMLNRRLSGFTPLEFATLCSLLDKLLE